MHQRVCLRINFNLQVGASVMVFRNLRHPELLNGKMFVVKRHTTRHLEVVGVDENGAGRSSHTLHRIDFHFEFSDMKVTRRQFPVRLAFSSTVNKEQGQTLRKLVVDLRFTRTVVCGAVEIRKVFRDASLTPGRRKSYSISYCARHASGTRLSDLERGN